MPRALRLELKTRGLKPLILPIKLHSLLVLDTWYTLKNKRKRDDSNIQVYKHNIQQISYFTNSNLSNLIRARPASIRHPFPRQGNTLPIKITNSMASRIRIDTLRLEDEQSTVNLQPLMKQIIRKPGEKFEFSFLMHEINVLTN